MTQINLSITGDNGLNVQSGYDGQVTTDFVDKLNEAVAAIAKDTPDIEISTAVFYNRDIDSASVTPNDVVCLSVIKGGYTACVSFYLVDTNTSPLEDRVIKLAKDDQVTEYHIPHFNSEVHDPDFLNNIRPRIAATMGDRKIVITESVVIYSTMEITDELVRKQAAYGVNRLYNKIMIDFSSGMADINLNTINRTQGSELKLDLRLLVEAGNDDAGIPIADSVTLYTSTNRINGNNRQRGKLNRRTDTTSIGTVSARASIMHVGGKKISQNGGGYLASNQVGTFHHAFAPQIILENVDMGERASFGKFLLLLANSSIIMNPNVVKKMYKPETIATLNTRCNLEGSDNPEPLSEDVVQDNFDEIFNMMFTQDSVMSLVVRPGTWEYEYTKTFLKAAEGDQKAVTYLREKIAEFINVNPDNVNVNGIVGTTIEEYLVGTHITEDGDTRSLSELDLLWLMNYAPEATELHQQWARSQHTHDVEEGLALKKWIISSVTQSGVRLLDRRFLVTFSPAMTGLFTTILNQITIPKTNNLDQFSNFVTNGWMAHAHSNFANGGWDNGNNGGNNNGNGNNGWG